MAGEHAKAHLKALAASDEAVQPGERAEYLRIAASSASGEAADRLRLEAADALLTAGDPVAADEVAASVVGLEPVLIAEAHLQRGRAAWARGLSDVALATYDSGLELVVGTETKIEVRLRVAQLHALLFGPVPKAHLAEARAALRLAQRLGVEAAKAEWVVGQALIAGGTTDDALKHLRAGVSAARTEGDFELEAEASNSLHAALHIAGFPDDARALSVEMAERARSFQLRKWEATFRWTAARIDYLCHAAYAEAIEVLRASAEEPAIMYPNRAEVFADLAVALACAGRVDEAWKALADPTDPGTAWGRDVLLWGRAEVAWLTGRTADALDAGRELARSSTALRLHGAAIRDWALLDVSQPPGPLVREDDTNAGYEFCARESEALRALAEGRPLEAEALFDELAQIWLPRTLLGSLRCAWAAGIAALNADCRQRGLERLLTTEEHASRALQPLLPRIRRSLRAAGVQRSAVRGRKQGLLTAREHEILQLVHTGATTAQIAHRLAVAPATVDAVVRSAKLKLNARTRRQAALLAVGR
jgi:DNA-binding CsgD family transcriptional regulator/tetratricopeptide (TPR) repeat protein